MQIHRRTYFTLRRFVIFWLGVASIVAIIAGVTIVIADYSWLLPYMACFGVVCLSAWACYVFANDDVEAEKKMQQEVMDKLSSSDDGMTLDKTGQFHRRVTQLMQKR